MKCELSVKQLTDAVECLQDYQRRLEVEAAALAALPEGRELAKERLEEAVAAADLSKYYLSL